MNKLEQLKAMTTVVADTGDIESIQKYQPVDATTNPSLLYKAAQLPQYKELVREAVHYAKSRTQIVEEQTKLIIDRLAVNFGAEILRIIPGRISTEVDARLSFDVENTIKRVHEIMELYYRAGVDTNRVLIKIASTWEGIQAAYRLEKQNIHCNMTLVFNFGQAVLCADSGVTLISPFVGRIFDWYKKYEGVAGYQPQDDPGVKSVTSIYNYYKRHNYKTVVMGASFRNSDEILELAGCDLLTIAPNFLDELEKDEGEVVRKLNPETAKKQGRDKIIIDEKMFRWHLNEDSMATEKLAEGIRKFTEDTRKLVQFVRDLCAEC